MNKRKNIIYIFADQWGKHSMGRYNKDIKTPNLDNFAQESFVFERAYSTCPICSPHRACLMSGTYPLRNGVVGNCKPVWDVELNENQLCITDVLKSENYNTAYIGKWHLDIPSARKRPKPHDGATQWDAYTPPGKRRHGVDFWYSYGTFDDHLNPHYWTDSRKMIKIKNKWSVEHETEIALNYIKDVMNSENPFAMFLSYNPPHTDYDLVPKCFLNEYIDKKLNLRENVGATTIDGSQVFDRKTKDIIANTKKYYAAISGIDYYLGKILDFLKNNGLYENTIIVVSSDHGDLMGSHGLYGKAIWYEEATNIPFIIGGAVRQGVSNQLIGSPDHAPTLLELADIPIKNKFDGISFAPVVLEKTDRNIYETLYIANYGEPSAVFKDKNENPIDYGYRCLKSSRYTYVCDKRTTLFDASDEFIFDLQNDKYEKTPIRINEDNKELFIYFRNELKKWLDKLGDGFKI
ncbi:MAG: sulfatase [Oscillospiraceae bacterium]